MKEKMSELKSILATVDDLGRTSAVLGWDQQAFMPPGGAPTRGNLLATIGRISHEMFTSERVGKLLEDLSAASADLDPDSDDARLVKVTQRQYEKSTKVPSEMVAEQAELSAVGGQAWQEARAKADFAHFEPHLVKIVDWNRRYAALFAPYEHIYDTVLDNYEPGMTTADVQQIFNTIRPQQVALIAAIADKPQVEDAFLHMNYDEQKQWDFGVEVISQYGYDWNTGRQDKVTHPFMTSFGYGDVRITTRVSDNFFNSHLFATMHEAGHALYEQGFPEKFARSPLLNGASLAVHESQSRMWENLVGRSRQFWTHFYPRLKESFPSQLGNVNVDTFYKGINKVAPSFIRVEADEATYNLHIMLRMEIEIALLEGSLEVKDLPDAWNTRMEEYLGITPPDDALGVLQDVHWSMGLLGYFSTYALGNLVSAQLWEKILEDIPDLYAQIEQAKFAPLLGWLREKVHVHGAKFEPQELVESVTGSKIDGGAYIKYLEKKFGDIYEL
ncbi:MAG: carboxypeptidase M32 [Anaerolineae bacterium]|nr:carboxypeptidase M32 [Anaerolineae bacterium]